LVTFGLGAVDGEDQEGAATAEGEQVANEGGG